MPKTGASLTVAQILSYLEDRAPSQTAESWDNVGLLAGDPSWKTSGAIVGIDLTQKAIEEAKSRGYRLIVNHHPCIFPKTKGISRIVGGASSGKTGLIFNAIRNGIAVAAFHTNFDRCALEVPQAISAGLGLTAKGRLIEKPFSSCIKLTVFVPRSHAEAVRQALGLAGAGHIGNYDFCTFSTTGEGTFRGGADTHPFLGQSGHLERADEVRVETILPRGMEKAVVRAMLKAHPYEEVAYDLYPVEQPPSRLGLVKGLGYGFWGEYPQSKPFSEVVKDVKTLFQVSGFLLTNPPPQRISRVAFAAGKGASVVEAAAQAGCDLMITGEAGYHEGLAVSGHRPERPMAIMELGHRESELFFVETMKDWLKKAGLKSTAVRGVHVKTRRFWA